MSTTADIDLGDLDLWRDGPPHELFAQLRREPLHFSELADFEHERGFWSVVRYEDIAAVGRDFETFSSERSILLVDKLSWDPEVPDPMDMAQHMLISTDPPRHDRMKALVQRAFNARRVAEHEQRIRDIINLVYDRALERHPDGRIDLVQDVALHVPTMVIGDMLGAPREDSERLVNWTNRTVAFEDPRLVPDLRDIFVALEEFIPYVDGVIRARRERPTEDLTTAFIQAEIDGDQLSPEEILLFFFLLMVAGNDSTR
ncbi:MAG: cytochrome P450, partial [Actinobacteria bacterium]|nr:cytochrome P450 [Actinomycetota bacterium]